MTKKIKNVEDKETIGNFGEYNQIYGQKIDDYIDEDSMGAIDAVRRTVVTHYSDRQISPGPYRGVVLKVLKPEFSWGDIFSLWESKIDFGPKYIIRVPELDSHIPAPPDLEATEGREYGIIRSHNVYTPASIKVGKEEEAEVGDLVWVNIKNDEYIYLGKVKNEASTAAVGPGDGGEIGPDGESPSYTAPPGGPFTAPQFDGFIKNSSAKGYFQGELLSDYFSKVRAKNIGPPSAQTDPKLDIVRTRSIDIAPRDSLYSKASGNRVLVNWSKPGGRGFNVRQDLSWVMDNLKAIINKLGCGFYGGSFYTGVNNSRGRGLSEHTIGGAIDMHLGTTYAGAPKSEEHNLEVMTNRQSWVLWLKMPNAKTIKHEGKSWSSVKKTINAVKVGYGPLKAPWNWKQVEGYWFNVTECFEWHSMVGLGPLGKKKWWKRPTPYKHGESWHYDHRNTHGYIPWQTSVADVIHSQSFPGYRTPASKEKIPKMKTANRNNVYNNGHFSNRPRRNKK